MLILEGKLTKYLLKYSAFCRLDINNTSSWYILAGNKRFFPLPNKSLI